MMAPAAYKDMAGNVIFQSLGGDHFVVQLGTWSERALRETMKNWSIEKKNPVYE